MRGCLLHASGRRMMSCLWGLTWLWSPEWKKLGTTGFPASTESSASWLNVFPQSIYSAHILWPPKAKWTCGACWQKLMAELWAQVQSNEIKLSLGGALPKPCVWCETFQKKFLVRNVIYFPDCHSGSVTFMLTPKCASFERQMFSPCTLMHHN